MNHDYEIFTEARGSLGALLKKVLPRFRTCRNMLLAVFLDEEGMELFLDVLRAFPNEPTIETKVLGLLNNIAEVAWLRTSLLVDPFIQVLHSRLYLYIHLSIFI